MTACNCCTQIEPGQLVEKDAIPAPLFQLFDVAILHYESETGEVSDVLIQILGIMWQPHCSHVSGWWYHVRYLNRPVGIESHLPPGYQDDCQEDELRAAQIGIF